MSVSHPAESGISKWVYRDISHNVCPWNERFAQELKERAFAAREVSVFRDARAVARDILAMSDEDFARVSEARR